MILQSLWWTRLNGAQMPLRATLNGQDLLAGDLDASAWAVLKSQRAALRMPCCGARAIMRVSKLGLRHFAHCSRRSYYADVHAPGHERKRTRLGTNDRAEADERGRKLYLDLLSGRKEQQLAAPTAVWLGELCDRYVKECPLHLDNATHGQKDAQTRLRILRSAIGDAGDVRNLTVNDVRQYEARRKKGGIRYRDGKGVSRATGVVRQRGAQGPSRSNRCSTGPYRGAALAASRGSTAIR